MRPNQRVPVGFESSLPWIQPSIRFISKKAALGFWVWLSLGHKKCQLHLPFKATVYLLLATIMKGGKSIDSGQPTTGNRGEGHKNQSTHRQREIAYKFVSNCFFYLQRGSIPQTSPLYKPAAVLSWCYPRGIVQCSGMAPHFFALYLVTTNPVWC